MKNEKESIYTTKNRYILNVDENIFNSLETGDIDEIPCSHLHHDEIFLQDFLVILKHLLQN